MTFPSILGSIDTKKKQGKRLSVSPISQQDDQQVLPQAHPPHSSRSTLPTSNISHRSAPNNLRATASLVLRTIPRLQQNPTRTKIYNINMNKRKTYSPTRRGGEVRAAHDKPRARNKKTTHTHTHTTSQSPAASSK